MIPIIPSAIDGMVLLDVPGQGNSSGFCVRGNLTNYIVTCAHCLPRLPDPGHGGDDMVHVKFRPRSKPNGEAVLAAVIFVDPCQDIAVLSDVDGEQPDQQQENHKYIELMEQALDALPLMLDVPPLASECRFHILTIEDVWLSGKAFFAGLDRRSVAIAFDDHNARIPGGTSGSPIFNSDGKVIGVVNIAATENPSEAGAVPAESLPAWLMRQQHYE